MRETVVLLEVRLRHADDVTAQEIAQEALDTLLTSRYLNVTYNVEPLILCNEEILVDKDGSAV